MLIYNYKVLNTPLYLIPPQGCSPFSPPSTSHVVYIHVHMDSHTCPPPLSQSCNVSPVMSPSWARRGGTVCPRGWWLLLAPSPWGGCMVRPRKDRASLCECCSVTCCVHSTTGLLLIFKLMYN